MIIAIVPAYNESKRIAAVIADLLLVVDEVVVVNDASTDTTKDIALAAGVTVLSHRINRGCGAALETGHMYAKKKHADFVVHFDGDGQFSSEDILPALNHLEDEHADILFGSRFLNNESATLPWSKRYLIHPIARYIDRLFGSVRLSDVHNGFRIIRGSALKQIVITQDGMAHASQIPELVKTHNIPYTEFPITVTYYEYGQTAKGGFIIIKDLFMKKWY